MGAGAIGGTVGARLVRDGHEVLLCDADPEHVAAVNERGLALEGPVEELTVQARAISPAELPDGLGAVLLAVKSQHTAAALDAIEPRLAPDGFVVSLQNGVNEPAIAARTARSGSSSCATGAPKSAITASPMNFPTVPPKRSSSRRRRP